MRLTALPAEISQLKNLRSLIAFKNELTSLPPALAECSKLETISVRSRPHPHPTRQSFADLARKTVFLFSSFSNILAFSKFEFRSARHRPRRRCSTTNSRQFRLSSASWPAWRNSTCEPNPLKIRARFRPRF
jgi:hypothetical protein